MARRARAFAESRAHGVHARGQQYLAGVLEGGEGGAAERSAALEFFARQGWKYPRRAIALFCPAVDRLEASQ